MEILSIKSESGTIFLDKDQEISFLKKVISLTPGHVYWKSCEGIYLGCNDNQAKNLGYGSGKEIIGKTDFDLPWKEQASQLREIDLAVINTGQPRITEEPVDINGKERVFLSNKTPLKDDDGKIIGVIGVSFDITDQKIADKLTMEKKASDKIAAAMKTLSSCIAHEVRTPLAIISINTDNLKLIIHSDKPDKKNKIDEFINNIKFAIRSGENIISMLLVRIRSTIGKQIETQKFTKNSIKSCVDSVINKYPFAINEKNIVIWHGNKNTDFDYIGDDLLTTHVLFNLIKNSLRAIKEADHGNIYINLMSDKDFNFLIFKDTASGIPKKTLDALFKQFSTNSKEGTGLGLVFCKMVMQAYGGDVTCDSKEGQYTEFRLKFPKITDGKASINN